MNKHSLENIFFNLFRTATFAGISILLGTILLLYVGGRTNLSFGFLINVWQHQDITRGGIAQAVIGSLWLGFGVITISFPIGIATAIFISEYYPKNSTKRVVQLAIRNLAGVPSIVYGLFGLAVFVNFFSFGTSLISAILTLSAMTLPWIISSSISALEDVPQSFRSSSLALGSTHWQMIKKTVLPVALPGCITGGIIGVGRAMGETAPIIMVGATFFMNGYPSSVFDKFMALPYHAFILSTQHASPHAQSYAASTALVMIMLTFFLTFGATYFRYRIRHRKDW